MTTIPIASSGNRERESRFRDRAELSETVIDEANASTIEQELEFETEVPLLEEDDDERKKKKIEEVSAANLESQKGSRWFPFLVALNIISTVSVVLLNKQLLSFMNIDAVTLTFSHYTTQAITVGIGVYFGFVVAKKMNMKEMVVLAFLVAVSVALNNLSLYYNSVGFTQLFKLLAIPWTAILERVRFQRYLSKKGWLSLAIVCFGVGLATITEIATKDSLIGFGVAFISLITTPIANAYAGHYMRQYGVGPFQLGVYQWPLVSLMLSLPSAYLSLSASSSASDAGVGVESSSISTMAIVLLILSCIAALSINATTSFILKHSSAVTLQVIGSAKTLLLVVLGTYVFSSAGGSGLSVKQLLGLAIGLYGVWAYGDEKNKNKAKDVDKEKEKEKNSDESNVEKDEGEEMEAMASDDGEP